jgi:N-acetyl-alpha-D-muramate 1-phosphate uridylyltransferase
MKGIIFSAGLGTRLLEHTANRPKALVEVNGKPLLFYAIDKLTKAGIRQIVVNVHHFADQIINYLNNNTFDAEIIISDERDQLLDTGGGLLNARMHLEGNEPIVAYNVDVLSTVDLQQVINHHYSKNALATLVVRKRTTNRYFMFDKNMLLCGWKNTLNGEQIISSPEFENSEPFAFSGIHIILPRIFEMIHQSGKFPITSLYLKLSETEKIIGYNDLSEFWIDCGKQEQLAMAENWLNKTI